MTKNKSLAVISLLLNLAIPGLGSIMGGKTNAGVIQLLLTAIVGITAFAGAFGYLNLPNVLIGAVAVSTCLWALLTSIEILQQSKK